MRTAAVRRSAARQPGSPITRGTTAPSAAMLVIGGGVCGLAWAAGLRGFMAQITDQSSVSWSGTFGYVLLPGLAIGIILGWAEHVRRTGGRRGWRWLALSPLLFAAVPLTLRRNLFRGGIARTSLSSKVSTCQNC